MFFSETLGDISLMPLFFQQGFQHTNSISSLLNICFQDGALEAKVRLRLMLITKKENQNIQEAPTRKKTQTQKNSNSNHP